MIPLVLLLSVAADPADAVVAALAKMGVTADTPGVAVAVHQPGTLKVLVGRGLANLGTKTPIDSTTRFELASLSKPFTALTVMALVERKKLAVADPVAKYLPELPTNAGPPLTVGHLLAHTSGFPEYFPLDVKPGAKGYRTNADYLPEFARQWKAFPPPFDVNARHEYTNTNYLLLAAIIERVEKRPFADVVKELVFQPAGMTNTFVFDKPMPAPPGPGVAVGYDYRPRTKDWTPGWGLKPDRDETMLVVGDGGVWSSLDDLLVFDQAMRANKIVSAATLSEMQKPTTTADKESHDYGFGLILYRSKTTGLRAWGHNGAWQGFKTEYYRNLTKDRTYIMLSNRSTFDPDKLFIQLEIGLR